MATSKWFHEKADQVEPGQLLAFGITINSRYGKAWELIEMLAFCEGIAEIGCEALISSVFYDSKANICSFEVGEGVRVRTIDNDAMLAIAVAEITQFVWLDDRVYHGNGLAE